MTSLTPPAPPLPERPALPPFPPLAPRPPLPHRMPPLPHAGRAGGSGGSVTPLPISQPPGPMMGRLPTSASAEANAFGVGRANLAPIRAGALLSSRISGATNSSRVGAATLARADAGTPPPCRLPSWVRLLNGRRTQPKTTHPSTGSTVASGSATPTSPPYRGYQAGYDSVYPRLRCRPGREWFGSRLGRSPLSDIGATGGAEPDCTSTVAVALRRNRARRHWSCPRACRASRAGRPGDRPSAERLPGPRRPGPAPRSRPRSSRARRVVGLPLRCRAWGTCPGCDPAGVDPPPPVGFADPALPVPRADPELSELDGSAHATACPVVATAAPTPNATARAPTRPMYPAEPTTISFESAAPTGP